MEGVVGGFVALALDKVLFLGDFSWSFVHLCLEHVEGDILVDVFLGDPLDQIFETLLADGILVAPERIGFDLDEIGDIDEDGSCSQFLGGDGLYFFLQSLEAVFMVDDSRSIDGFKRMRVVFDDQFSVMLFFLFMEIGFNSFEVVVGLFDDDHCCEGKLILDI